jgi:hypothetical protein
MAVERFVCLALTTKHPTHGWEIGRRALGALYDGTARLVPERVGFDDTEMRKGHPCASVEDVRPLWAPYAAQDSTIPTIYDAPTLYWKRASPPKAEGAFDHTTQTKHGDIVPATVRMVAGYKPDIDYLTLFTTWCALYRPLQGYLHLFTAPEICEGYPKLIAGAGEFGMGGMWGKFRIGSFGSVRDQKTYNLGAANYFPRDILTDAKTTALEAEGFSVTPLGEGRLLQLCAGLDAVAQDFASFSQRRVLAKRIIGPQFFVIGSEPGA